MIDEEKLNENLHNIKGAEVTEDNREGYLYDVTIDGYSFEISSNGEVNLKGTETSGGSGGGETNPGGTGSESSGNDEKYDTLVGEINELKQQLEQSNGEIEKLRQQVDEDMANMWNWHEIDINLEMPKEDWGNNKIEVPEIKDAKRIAIMLSTGQWYFLDRVEDAVHVWADNASLYAYGYFSFQISVHFDAGIVWAHSREIGEGIKNGEVNVPKFTKIKYIK